MSNEDLIAAAEAAVLTAEQHLDEVLHAPPMDNEPPTPDDSLAHLAPPVDNEHVAPGAEQFTPKPTTFLDIAAAGESEPAPEPRYRPVGGVEIARYLSAKASGLAERHPTKVQVDAHLAVKNI